jgi:hypothetical protein
LKLINQSLSSEIFCHKMQENNGLETKEMIYI